MSILIKGMEMPKSCIACHLNFGEKRPEYGLTICCPYSDGVISWRDKAFDNGRLASCGIVPVPPHGDLVDRREAIIDANERAYDFWLSDDEVNATIQFLKEQTTIIPAEEGEA